MGWRRSLAIMPVVALATALLLPGNAQAAFHLMKVREVHTGGASGGSYVELQMWSGGQNFVSGHKIDLYASDGEKAHSYTFPGSVANGSNQATILVAGEGYAATFPAGLAPDFIDTGLDIPAAGGAVCFPDGFPPDCVSWGNFSGDESLPSTAGTPASPGGVTAGKALHRSIAEPCATLLEPGDDSDDSATDFSEQEPNPRSNSSEIVEEECAPPDETPPDTIIDTHPPNPSGSDVSFTYHASEGGSTFECSLSSGEAPDGFEACSAGGKGYSELADGEYTFKVRAEDASGNLDLTPATYSWTVEESAPDTTPPDTVIDSTPPDPTESSTASFTYHSTEVGSSFECKLDAGAFAGCSAAGVTYTNLANGSHTFQVRATDPSENTDETPAGYSWDVVLPVAEPSPSEPPPTHLPPGPLPEPTPPAPGTAFAASVAQVRGAVASLKMRCNGPMGGRCQGALRLVARIGGAGSSRARSVIVGRARYGFPVGARRRVRVRLTGRGKRLVRRAGRRGLAVRLLGPGVRNRTVKLRRAGARR